MKNRNKNIPSHKAYKKAKKEHKKDFHRLHHLSVTCFVAETNKQKPKNDTNDQNENGRLYFMQEGTWGLGEDYEYHVIYEHILLP